MKEHKLEMRKKRVKFLEKVKIINVNLKEPVLKGKKSKKDKNCRIF